MERRGRLEVRPFSDDVIDDAASLLAARHRQQRTIEPGLSPTYEEASATRAEIATLAGKEGASGAVAMRGGEIVGYLLGAPRAPLFGPNMWVEACGHAAAEPEVARDLYGFVAGRWGGRRGNQPLRARPRNGCSARGRLVPSRLRAAAGPRDPRRGGSR